jgi:hypothetical protein
VPLPATSEDPPPDSTAISEDGIKSALSSFPEGTAPGPSSLCAAFLKEAAFCPNSDQAAKTTSSLTKLVNLIAARKCSPDVAPLLCGASLFALLKKEPGAIRPIAVGEVLRHLVAKCLAFANAPQAANLLNPHQLGVGTRGGCETIIHSVQAILSDAAIPANNKWVLQVDYSNAFNTLDRSHLFKEVRAQLPGLSAFVEWSYGSRPFLFFWGLHHSQ